jgi:hypothetical protein
MPKYRKRKKAIGNFLAVTNIMNNQIAQTVVRLFVNNNPYMY